MRLAPLFLALTAATLVLGGCANQKEPAEHALAKAEASLREAIASRKSAMDAAMAAARTEWADLCTSVPQMVDAIHSRVGTLTQSRRLPKNLTQSTLDAAKSSLDNLKATWSEASAEFASGNATAAVEKAKAAKAKGEEVLQQLGMSNS